MIDRTLTPEPLQRAQAAAQDEAHALLVLWSRDVPSRAGEILLIPPRSHRTWTVGRGDGATLGDPTRLGLMRQRPGVLDNTGALRLPHLSRHQLDVKLGPDQTLLITNVGRCPLRHEGVETPQALSRPGDVLELVDQLLLLHVRRSLLLPETGRAPDHPFGEADAAGIVGESPAAWALRRQLLFAAGQNTHVLILGESGTGKELVARGIHLASARAKRPLVSRSAATLPESLMDAELFGNLKNYPNVGMPERPGLVGEADTGCLFLDEIGELPVAQQSHLLRLMDAGEYQRLGEATVRRADVRVLAATNRPPEALKHDFAARFHAHVEVPDLNTRREDVPLLARHILRRIATRNPEIRKRFFHEEADEPRLSPQLTLALTRRRYTTHVRELEQLLWKSLAHATGPWLEPVEGGSPAPAAPETPASDPRDITAERIHQALEEHRGSVGAASDALGLSSRYVLYRLMKKHGITPPSAEDG